MADAYIVRHGGSGGGAELAPLSKPATSAEIKEGYQAYTDEGDVIIGAYSVSDVYPQLNAVSISKSGNNLNISNPSTNGNFVKGYKVIGNNEVLKQLTSTTFDLTSVAANRYVMKARATAEGFTDSADSGTVDLAVFEIRYNLTNLKSSISTKKTTNGQTLSFTLTPTTGKHLPPTIWIDCNGRSLKYTYDSYSGAVSVSALELAYATSEADGATLAKPQILMGEDGETLAIGPVANATSFDILSGDNTLGNVEVEITEPYVINITASALDVPKLRTPTISIEDGVVSVETPKYATSCEYYCATHNQLLFTDDDLPVKTFSVEAVSGASYGFALNSNSYYESKNYHVSSSYALCKVVFNVSSATTARFDCINSGESNYDYGLISQIDQTLSLSNNDDGSTGTTTVLKNFKGASSTSVVQVNVSVPAGEHFVYVKYRKDGSGNSGNDSLQFKVTLL